LIYLSIFLSIYLSTMRVCPSNDRLHARPVHSFNDGVNPSSGVRLSDGGGRFAGRQGGRWTGVHFIVGRIRWMGFIVGRVCMSCAPVHLKAAVVAASRTYRSARCTEQPALDGVTVVQIQLRIQLRNNGRPDTITE
jgi:hypothetical protein